MSAILLDTSAYSAFMRGHPEVKTAVQRSEAIRLNPVVLGELLSGFRIGKKEKRNRKELEGFLASPRRRPKGTPASEMPCTGQVHRFQRTIFGSQPRPCSTG